jgi:hypothetical protein
MLDTLICDGWLHALSSHAKIGEKMLKFVIDLSATPLGEGLV